MDISENQLRLAAIISGSIVVLGSLATGLDGTAKALAGLLIGFGVGMGVVRRKHQRDGGLF